MFFSEDGINKRLKKILDNVLDSSNGIIKNEISTLTSDDLKEIQQFFLKEKVLTNYYEEKLSTLNQIIK